MSELERIVGLLQDVSRQLQFDDLPDAKDFYYADMGRCRGCTGSHGKVPGTDPRRPRLCRRVRNSVGPSASGTQHNRLPNADEELGRIVPSFVVPARQESGHQARRAGKPEAAHVEEGPPDGYGRAPCPDVTTKQVLSLMDPCLRIEGWRPERTEMHARRTAQRAELDRHR